MCVVVGLSVEQHRTKNDTRTAQHTYCSSIHNTLTYTHAEVNITMFLHVSERLSETCKNLRLVPPTEEAIKTTHTTKQSHVGIAIISNMHEHVQVRRERTLQRGAALTGTRHSKTVSQLTWLSFPTHPSHVPYMQTCCTVSSIGSGAHVHTQSSHFIPAP